MAKKALISYHSDYANLAKEISKGLSSKDVEVLLVSDDRPALLADREQAVQWCDVFLALVSVKYQRTVSCMELLNYARERRLKKPLVTLVGQPEYTPSGATGALSVCGTYVEYDSIKNYKLIQDAIKKEPTSSKGKKPGLDAGGTGKVGKLTDGTGVFISCDEDVTKTGHIKLIRRGIGSGEVTVGGTKDVNTSSIDKCKVFIALLSPGYEKSSKCQAEYERARLGKKTILPVKTSKFYPSGWLALAIAGKRYDTLTDEASATKRVYDSSPLQDFGYAVEFLQKSEYSEEERDTKQRVVFEKELEETRVKLQQMGGSWPPPKRQVARQKSLLEIKPDDLIIKKEDNLRMAYIHHEITRMAFSPPEPLFDPRGIPIKRKFDCMISYQWDIQSFVRDIYMDLDMRTLKVWMDIYGDMQGNINDAMANGIESSSCIIAFLTKKYLTSLNCNIELKYAIRRNKPIIFLYAESDVQIPDWLKEKVRNSLTFPLRSIRDCGVEDDGLPRINRIAEAVRKVVQMTMKEQRQDEMTEEVWKVYDQLEDGLHAICELQGKKRFETCTRCGNQFDENTKAGCKTHRAYYMGGTIIAGRWVCCSQREKDSLGCEPAEHTARTRSFQQMPGYDGCYKWV